MTYKKTKIIIIIVVLIAIIVTNFLVDHNSDAYYLIGQLYFIELLLIGMWFYHISFYSVLLLSSFHIIYHLFVDTNRLVQVSVESLMYIAFSIFIYIVQHITLNGLIQLYRTFFFVQKGKFFLYSKIS